MISGNQFQPIVVLLWHILGQIKKKADWLEYPLVSALSEANNVKLQHTAYLIITNLEHFLKIGSSQAIPNVSIYSIAIRYVFCETLPVLMHQENG
jgi:hypothetical protein